MSRKKNKKRIKIENMKNTITTIVTFIVLLILVLGGAYLIFETNILNPKINKITASYISLNNRDRTDMLKINNLKKMTTEKGKSNKNHNYIELDVTGEKNMDYDIVIYPVNNNIDFKYLNFALEYDNKVIINSLDQVQNSTDGGKVIYSNKIDNNNKYTLRMWISNDYNAKIKENSFEVKIKSR